MKKIYTIEITEGGNKNVWYHNKVGTIYEAELDFKLYNSHNTSGYVVFRVCTSPGHCVRLLDCKVISERIFEY